MRNAIQLGLWLAGLFWVAAGCVEFKPNVLYVDPDADKPKPFFISSEIYSEQFTSEGWKTMAPEGCLSVETSANAAYKGSLGLHIKWNRVKEGCPWLGFGFGWDNWTGKNLTRIKNTAAIVFYVRMPEGERTNLPWAIGLEDYAGGQAWLGMNKNAIKADKISTEWTKIELPLSEFNWDEQQADASIIKQILFQVEADGEIFIDEIHIAPYTGGFRKRAHLSTLPPLSLSLDAPTGDAIWSTDTLDIEGNTVHLAIENGFLCIATNIADKTPLQNSKTGKDIYDGDGFEIAFSTDLAAKRTRLNYRMSDQHIGFALGKDLKMWNYRTREALQFTEAKTWKTPTGYVFKARIQLAELGINEFEAGQLYGLEMAINKGTEKGRDKQLRWNDPSNPGFHENPSLWGEMLIIPPKNQAAKP
jgi:hypothetical protein